MEVAKAGTTRSGRGGAAAPPRAKAGERRRTAAGAPGATARRPAAATPGEAATPRASAHARTCVACRRPEPRGELVRLVEGPDGSIAVDARGRAAGRGAWVHPTRACMLTAAKRHAAERSLRVPARAVDGEALVTGAAAAFRRRAHSLLVTAWRRRSLAVGAEATAEALERGRVPLLLLATDAGEASRALGAEADEPGGTQVRSLGAKSELGGVLGRGEVAIVAVVDHGIAAELVSTIDRLAGLEG